MELHVTSGSVGDLVALHVNGGRSVRVLHADATGVGLGINRKSTGEEERQVSASLHGNGRCRGETHLGCDDGRLRGAQDAHIVSSGPGLGTSVREGDVMSTEDDLGLLGVGDEGHGASSVEGEVVRGGERGSHEAEVVDGSARGESDCVCRHAEVVLSANVEHGRVKVNAALALEADEALAKSGARILGGTNVHVQSLESDIIFCEEVDVSVKVLGKEAEVVSRGQTHQSASLIIDSSSLRLGDNGVEVGIERGSRLESDTTNASCSESQVSNSERGSASGDLNVSSLGIEDEEVSSNVVHKRGIDGDSGILSVAITVEGNSAASDSGRSGGGESDLARARGGTEVRVHRAECHGSGSHGDVVVGKDVKVRRVHGERGGIYGHCARVGHKVEVAGSAGGQGCACETEICSRESLEGNVVLSDESTQGTDHGDGLRAIDVDQAAGRDGRRSQSCTQTKGKVITRGKERNWSVITSGSHRHGTDGVEVSLVSCDGEDRGSRHSEVESRCEGRAALL
mmetsp:Transcript_113557/g.159226  ORF Transcript_113557/g.159226 Transcript_113557/m.159226 type:complete len:514 (-) Transcript_113557:1315-2856(-)